MSVLFFRDTVLPVAAQHCLACDGHKDANTKDSERPRWHGPSSLSRADIKGVLDRADFNAFQASRALVAPHTLRRMNLDGRGALLLYIVRSQYMSTPQIPDNDGQHNKDKDGPQCERRDVREKELHLNIRHPIVWTLDEDL